MKKVLFIGNSHTFVENLPWVFTSVCQQAGIPVHAAMITHPGCDLRWHIDWMCAIPNIKMGGYDYVVLQQRTHPFDGAEALLAQGKILHEVIEVSGSTTVITETWTEKRNPDGQKRLRDAFERLQSECPGSMLAPCGTAWHSLREVMDLYAPDGEHQNPRGAYLNACIQAKLMFGVDPMSLGGGIVMGMENRIPSGMDSEAANKAFTPAGMEISEEEARILQKAASEAV